MPLIPVIFSWRRYGTLAGYNLMNCLLPPGYDYFLIGNIVFSSYGLPLWRYIVYSSIITNGDLWL